MDYCTCIQRDLNTLNIDLHIAWKRAQKREQWRHGLQKQLCSSTGLAPNGDAMIDGDGGSICCEQQVKGGYNKTRSLV